MTRPEQFTNQANLEQMLQKISTDTDAQMEIISGVPVFTLKAEQRDEVIAQIVNSVGERGVFRIINSIFVDDAIELGTDKAHIDGHDFRAHFFDISENAYGHDIWGVENAATQMGLSAVDSFCGTPKDQFIKETSYKSRGLGVPEDRSAVLIFDGTKLTKLDLSDGYVFAEPDKKKEALLAVIKFEIIPLEFETRINATEDPEEQIAIIETEISDKINTPADLSKGFYLIFNIIKLLRSESLSNNTTPSEKTSLRISRLNKALDTLNYEMSLIKEIREIQREVTLVRNFFVTNGTELMPGVAVTSPELNKYRWKSLPQNLDETIAKLAEYLSDPNFPEKHKAELLKIQTDALKCKTEIKNYAR